MVTINEIQTRVQQYFDFPKNGIGAEVGVARAYNAMHLYHITKPKLMYLCDTWLNDYPYEFHVAPDLWNGPNKEITSEIFKKELSDGTVSIFHGYSAAFFNSLEDDHLDWIYIDANHRYEGVKPDLERAYDKVKNNGIIAGHDFYVNPTAWKSGVVRAVNEMIQDGKIIMESITMERFASYVCRVIK